MIRLKLWFCCYLMLVASCESAACGLSSQEELAGSVSFWERRHRLEKDFIKELTSFLNCSNIARESAKKVENEFFIPRDPQRMYIFLPDENKIDQQRFPGLSTETAAEMQAVLDSHAERLLQLAIDESRTGNPAWAFQLLNEILYFSPNHKRVRKILGHEIRDDDQSWKVKSDRLKIRRGTRRHRDLRFPAKGYWLASTAHFQVVSTATEKQTVELAKALEQWHDIWRQIFFEYYADSKNLNRWIEDGERRSLGSQRKFKVAFFSDRTAYVEHLSGRIPGIEASTGYYNDADRYSYFYASSDADIRDTWKHELTHQLFQESQRSVTSPFLDHSLWLGEGIAMYFESLTEQGAYWTLGGFDARRLQFARLRRLKEGFRVPLQELSNLSQNEFQQQPNLAKIYSQSAGVCHMLMDSANGEQRSLIRLLSLVYKGRFKVDSFEELIGLSYQQIEDAYHSYLQLDSQQLRFLTADAERKELCLIGVQLTRSLLDPLSKTGVWEWLDFSACDVRGRALEPLEECESIDQLFLTGGKIDASTVSILSKIPLQAVDLSGTNMNDQFLIMLSQSSSLATINVKKTDVTAQAVREFSSRRPDVQISF